MSRNTQLTRARKQKFKAKPPPKSIKIEVDYYVKTLITIGFTQAVHASLHYSAHNDIEKAASICNVHVLRSTFRWFAQRTALVNDTMKETVSFSPVHAAALNLAIHHYQLGVEQGSIELNSYFNSVARSLITTIHDSRILS